MARYLNHKTAMTPAHPLSPEINAVALRGRTGSARAAQAIHFFVYLHAVAREDKVANPSRY